MKNIFIVFDIYPFSRSGCNVVCAGESMSAVIDDMIEAGLIDENTQITPLAMSNARYTLEDYLPSWRTELRLLTKNEFNDWFKSYDYRAWEIPFATEKK
jgi:hypothetical protein